MDNHEIALILYKLSCDMDYMDYVEYMESELEELEREISHVGGSLKYILETIAEDNSNLLQEEM